MAGLLDKVLDMSLAARTARARAMGFDPDVTWYHGTKGNARIDPNQHGILAFDPNLAEEGLYGRGVYATSQPAIAGGGKRNTIAPQGYATNEALNTLLKKESELYPEIAEMKKTLARFEAEGNAEMAETFRRGIRTAETELDELSKWKTGGPAVYPLRMKVQNPFDPDKMRIKRHDLDPALVAQIEDKLSDSGKNPKGKWPMSYDMLSGTLGHDGAHNVLKSMGYDGITHKGGQITGAPAHRVMIAFEPNQVRSVNAAFDPAKASSSDLLAGVAPWAAAGGLGLLAASMPGESRAAKLSREMGHNEPSRPVDRLGRLQAGMQAGATANVPIVSDAMGLLGDALMYYRDPSSRTWGNYLGTALGVLPLIP